MRKIIIPLLIFLLLMNTSYAQENYLYITMDMSNNVVDIDSNYNVREFNIEDYINKIGNEYFFTFSYKSEYSFDNFKLKIVLPEESIISKNQDALIVSRPVKISTDGRKIYLEWSKQLGKNEEFTAFVQYKAKKFELNYILIFIILILSLTSFFVGYKIKLFKKERFIRKIMPPDEKKVFDIIKREKEVTQDDIRRKLEWSKTKTSKIIRNLEIKELIVKKPYKKTNKLKIK
ncbi:MAG: hypothetical protein J7K26_00195 [Candidatus Aenigmarchaeota archaeon]|nr:hypothetical protein [Candidatus Aenigmarchaeota archaeon]